MSGRDTATPVGDWMRRRYPPNPGATHYLGEGDDPGCCAGPHPMCTYDAAFREGARAERERIANLAEKHNATYAEPHPVIPGRSPVAALPFADLIRAPAPVLDGRAPGGEKR